MVDVKITQLPAASSSSGTDVYPMVQSGTTKQITYTNLFTNVTLITPNLGTPSAGTLTSCTGLPIASGVSGLGANVATFLATPSSANLISAMQDETGTGSLVFSTSPTFTGMFKIPTAAVAAAGSSNTDAAAVAAGFTLVSGANGTKGVKLPTAVAGSIAIIKNADAAILKVYPDALDRINALTVTTGSYNMAASTSVILIAYDAATWYSIPLVAS